MASTAVSTHSGAGPLSLMSCVRESSPQESIPDIDNDKTIASKKKFWNPRKWFKRKSNKASEESIPITENSDLIVNETLRSRSTSEISETDDAPKRRSGTPIHHPGLSVSHDSIFHSPNSGSELELDEAQSSSSLSIQQHPTQTELRLQTELSERLRLRRGRGDTSEDDEGLPRSPCCNSPTATEGLLEKTVIKNHPTKSHSTCSDGSLLSMCSSDIEEDSFVQQSSRNSSKISLSDKKVADQDSEWELGPSHASAPLNHSAAHHRVAVRPKRTHGAPRRNRIPPVGGALPTTPEVNEDISLRSVTPEVSKETVTELYSSSMSKNRTEIQLKCSSLPPGLAPPGSENNKLSRSRSSASSKSQDAFSALGEEEEDKDDKKTDNSIFSRLFPRRSAKKKKTKQEIVSTSYTKQIESITSESTVNYSTQIIDKKPILDKPKSGPASRQRVLPIDLPASPEQIHRELDHLDKTAISTSPLQLELENHLRQRMTLSLSTSPTKQHSLPILDTPPKSPKMQEFHIQQNFWSGDSQLKNIISKNIDAFEESKSNKLSHKITMEENGKVKITEENRSKMKIAGLSSLQQRVLQLSDDDNFKSLTDFAYNEEVTTRQITKSHSFRSTLNETDNKSVSSKDSTASIIEKDLLENITKNINIVKAASAESIKKEENNVFKTESRESLESTSSAKSSSTEYLDSLDISNGITISGPSHTSVFSISKLNNQMDDKIVKPVLLKMENAVTENCQEEQTFKEQQISVTKIHVKRDTLQISTTKETPEFLNVHLNKVEHQPSSNVVLTANLKSDHDEKPKTVFNFDITQNESHELSTRKFSQDDIEVIDKEINEVDIPYKNVSTPSTPNVIITSMTPPPSARAFKKHPDIVTSISQTRKTSLVSTNSETTKPKISLRTKSNSLDIVDSLKQDDVGQTNIDKQRVLSTTDLSDITVVRRKSLIKQKQDEEPELMKVFARRSLKVKDGEELSQQVLMMVENGKVADNVNKTKECDKENRLDSGIEDRKKCIIKEPEKVKEPLVETKFVETTEVTLRKPINNKLFAYQQRTISLNIPKVNEINNTEKIQKKNSFSERPKTEISDKLLNKTWITTVRKDKDVENNDDVIKKISRDSIITEITSKSDFINEDFPTIPKNFNQRKAEWEKRAQEALKKNVP